MGLHVDAKVDGIFVVTIKKIPESMQKSSFISVRYIILHNSGLCRVYSSHESSSSHESGSSQVPNFFLKFFFSITLMR